MKKESNSSDKKILVWPLKQHWFWIIVFIWLIYNEAVTHNIKAGLLELALGNLLAIVLIFWITACLFRWIYVAGYNNRKKRED